MPNQPAPGEGSSGRLEWLDMNAEQPTVISASPPLDLPTTAYHSPNGPPPGDDLTLLPPGITFGHFRIESYIGGGGMGQVYRAIDLALDRPVAIKVLSRARGGDRETIARFVNEAKAAARLNHDNIAHVYYTGQREDLHYIAFEYVDGMNLRTIVEEHGTLPLDGAVSYALQIAQALQHASSRGIVHRDIKPSNVLVTADGRVKLIDLGLARQLRPDSPGTDLTATGITLGTFDYISPEQARDPRTADVRSDIYSLGCTLFYMLTGRPPFPEGTMLQKLLQHQGDEPPDIREFRPGLPEEVARVLRKMLAKDPRHRFQDPHRLIEALVILAEDLGLRPVSASQGVWLLPRRPSASVIARHMPWLAPIALLLLTLLGLNIVWRGPEGAAVDTAGPIDFVEPANPAPSDGSDATTGPASGDVGPPSGGGSSGPAATTTSTDAAPPADDNGTASLAELLQFPPLLPPGATAIATLEGPRDRAGALNVASGNSLGLAMLRPPDLASEGLRVSPSLDNGDAAPPAAPPVDGADFVVQRPGEPPRAFSALVEAVDAAGDQGVVELRFDDLRQLKPLTFTGRSVTLRAGSGFHPRLLFAPAEADKPKHPRGMLTLTDSRVVLQNIRLELDIPHDVPAERWSLCEVASNARLELERCCLTIRNAGDDLGANHQEASFIYALDTPRPGAGGDPASAPRAEVSMRDCFVRGEAVVVRIEDGCPLACTIDNSLLLTTETLLTADGADSTTVGDSDVIRIEMEHVTAVAGPALFRFQFGEFSPNPLLTSVNVGHCILQTGGGAIVQHSGVTDVNLAQTSFFWLAEGQNFYQQVGDPWTLRPLDALMETVVVSLEDWQQLWGIMPSVEAVLWRITPDESRPIHRRVPSEYTIDTTRDYNPVLDSDGPGRHGGCDTSRLPAFETAVSPDAGTE